MLPLWFVIALVAVAGKSVFYGYQKHLFDTDDSITPLQLGFTSSLAGALLTVPLTLYSAITGTLEPLTPRFVLIVAALGLIEVGALAAYLYVLHELDFGIASPLKKLKPAFVGVLEPVVFGIPFVWPVLAAALTTAGGAYIVLIEDNDIWAPFRRIHSPELWLGLGVAVSYAVLSLGTRFGVLNVSPFTYGALVFTTMTAGFGTWLAHRGELSLVATDWLTSRRAVTVGGLGVGRSLATWFAYALASATLITSVTQLTVVVDVLIGGLLLGESETKMRLLGAAVILLGVVALVWVAP
jgi:drug/metabolite transporter (DMT)-like permease